jgi:tetratricopeptide (TPR) repeat protein
MRYSVSIKYTGLLLLFFLSCNAMAQTSPKAKKLTEKGRALYSEGEWKKALEVFDKVLELENDAPLVYMYRARCHIKRRNHDEAVKDFQRGLDADPENTIILSQRSIYRSKNQDIFGAFDDLEKAIEIDPKGELYYQHGLLNLILEDENSAVKDFVKAVELNPKHMDAHKKLAEMRFDSGEFEKAIGHYSFMVERPSTRKKGLYNRGICYLNLNNDIKALADLEAYLKEAPNSFRANKFAAIAERGLKNYASAITYLTRCIELQPKSAKALVERARDKYSLKDYEGSLEDIDGAIEMNPADSEAWVVRHFIHDNMMLPDSALADAQMARALDAQNSRHYTNIAYIYLRMHLPDSARVYAHKVMKYDKKSLGGLSILASAAEDEKKMDEALSWGLKIIEAHPKHMNGYNNVGYFLIMMDSFEQAIPYFETTLNDFDSTFSNALNNLGYCLYMTGKKEEGLAYIEKAKEMDPDNFFHLFFEAKIAFIEGKKEEGCKLIQDGLDKDFDYFYGPYLTQLQQEFCSDE